MAGFSLRGSTCSRKRYPIYDCRDPAGDPEGVKILRHIEAVMLRSTRLPTLSSPMPSSSQYYLVSTMRRPSALQSAVFEKEFSGGSLNSKEPHGLETHFVIGFEPLKIPSEES